MTSRRPERRADRVDPTRAATTGRSTTRSWGSLWLVQLAEASEVYLAQLRSRRRMRVIDLITAPGRVHARVVDRRGEIHPIDLEIRRLSGGETDDVVESVGRSAGILAALLDGRVPGTLIDTTREMEIDLFPGPSDIRTSCSCEDWADPCPHAVALIRAVAESVDRDPFTLFELRGLPRTELLDRLNRVRDPELAAPSDRRASDPWEGWDSTVVSSHPPVVRAALWPTPMSSGDDRSADDEIPGLDPDLTRLVERGRATAVARADRLLRDHGGREIEPDGAATGPGDPRSAGS